MFKFVVLLANGMWLRKESEVNDADVVLWRVRNMGWDPVSAILVTD